MARSSVASDPKWVTARGSIMGVTHLAVRARVDGDVVWLPRTAIEDAGDEADEALMSGKFLPIVELSVAKWKAKELGWA
jgi:hypothetical protein